MFKKNIITFIKFIFGYINIVILTMMFTYLTLASKDLSNNFLVTNIIEISLNLLTILLILYLTIKLDLKKEEIYNKRYQ